MTQQSLTGLRVIDASRVLAGPYCAQILGDHGADVIKVESPDGDETRSFGPPVKDGSAAYYHSLNRNKRGIVLDLGREAARDVFWRLVAGADVLIENFKASTLRSWGVADPEEIGHRYPRLVHCRITGFGDDGPLGALPGYDAAVQAAAGLMATNGEAEGPPMRLGIPAVDLSTGMQAAIAILAALQERNRSGLGQLCDIALYDCALSVAHPHLANYLWSGTEPRRHGNGHPNLAPYDAFETRTGWIYICVGNNRQFRTLCEHLGQPEIAADPRFRSNLARTEHRDALTSILRAALAGIDGPTFAEALLRLGVPCAPILGIGEAAAAAHTAHRAMVLEQDGYRGPGIPAKLRRTPGRFSRPPPRQGQHTQEILRELADGPEDIAALERAIAPGETLPQST